MSVKPTGVISTTLNLLVMLLIRADMSYQTYQKVEQPADCRRQSADRASQLDRSDFTGIQKWNTNEAKCVNDVVHIPIVPSAIVPPNFSNCSTNRKNTAALLVPLLFVDDRPVTHARQIDMPAALTIINGRLPNRSTVKEQIMPPRMMQACDAAASAPASTAGKCRLSS